MGTVLRLFFVFLKIGAVTFGSGYVMVLSIEKTLVFKEKWLTKEEYMDYLTIAQSSPGPLVVNLAVFIGHHKFGWSGAIATFLGTVLPSFVILLLIAMFFSHMNENETVAAVFKGLRPAVVGVILSPVIRYMKDIHKWEYPIVLATAFLLFLWVPAYAAILLTIAFGMVYTYLQKKRLNR